MGCTPNGVAKFHGDSASAVAMGILNRLTAVEIDIRLVASVLGSAAW
jgi:hypothetical protein